MRLSGGYPRQDQLCFRASFARVAWVCGVRVRVVLREHRPTQEHRYGSHTPTRVERECRRNIPQVGEARDESIGVYTTSWRHKLTTLTIRDHVYIYTKRGRLVM